MPLGLRSLRRWTLITVGRLFHIERPHLIPTSYLDRGHWRPASSRRGATMAPTDMLGSLRSQLEKRVWGYRYDPLSDGEDSTKRRRPGYRIGLTGSIIVAVFFLGLFFLPSASTIPTSNTCSSPTAGFKCHAPISRLWGQYSPFFSISSSIPPSLPESCTLTFAQILSRHGARDPTLGKSLAYGAVIGYIQENVHSYGEDVKWLKSYTYALGADELTRLGRREMRDSGVAAWERYGSLLTDKDEPFIRADEQKRVVDSAEEWALGFHSARTASKSVEKVPYPILSIPRSQADGTPFNNTLSHSLCPAFESDPKGAAAKAAFGSTFLPAIAARLNALLPGANITSTSAGYMMDLCPFETVADSHNALNADLSGRGSNTLSAFCSLFTLQEWKAYDYWQSLEKWYGYGAGHALGATQGVGWVNELVARLTGRAVVDHTSTNSTLDGDGATFPLGRRLYADFSHDNDMAGVMAALGLYNSTLEGGGLGWEGPAREGGEMGGFSASWTVPFGGRVVVEKMRCGGGRRREEGEELVRVLVNDRVIPLLNCGADELGRCTLEKFAESLSFARNGGFWDRCHAEGERRRKWRG